MEYLRRHVPVALFASQAIYGKVHTNLQHQEKCIDKNLLLIHSRRLQKMKDGHLAIVCIVTRRV